MYGMLKIADFIGKFSFKDYKKPIWIVDKSRQLMKRYDLLDFLFQLFEENFGRSIELEISNVYFFVGSRKNGDGNYENFSKNCLFVKIGAANEQLSKSFFDIKMKNKNNSLPSYFRDNYPNLKNLMRVSYFTRYDNGGIGEILFDGITKEDYLTSYLVRAKVTLCKNLLSEFSNCKKFSKKYRNTAIFDNEVDALNELHKILPISSNLGFNHDIC